MPSHRSSSSPIASQDSFAERMGTPQKLRVAELREALKAAGQPTGGKKAELVERLQQHLEATEGNASARSVAVEEEGNDDDADDGELARSAVPAGRSGVVGGAMRSARAAAADKVAARESRAVEHIAEHEDLDEEASEWMPLDFEVESGEAAATPLPAARAKRRSTSDEMSTTPASGPSNARKVRSRQQK